MRMNFVKHRPATARTVKLSIGFVALFGLATAASAHVKWFTHTDGRDRPVEPFALLTPTFGTVFCVALVLVFVGFLLDGWIAKRWPWLLKMGRTTEAFEQRVIRAGAAAYFIFLSSVGGIILTPELQSTASWLPVVQFLAALCLVWRQTCIVSGAAILILYGYAVSQYGVFHLVDYVFMLTLALYLASYRCRGQGSRACENACCPVDWRSAWRGPQSRNSFIRNGPMQSSPHTPSSRWACR